MRRLFRGVFIAVRWRHVQDRDALRSVVPVPNALRDNDERAGAKGQVSRIAALEQREVRLTGKDMQEFISRGMALPGRCSGEAGDAHVQS
jgi:hypothetical protein